MNCKIITIEYQVKCDRCGVPIKPGQHARLIMNEKCGTVRFEHLRCPGSAAAVVMKPIVPKNTPAMAMA
jgi:hypothetical protein